MKIQFISIKTFATFILLLCMITIFPLHAAKANNMTAKQTVQTQAATTQLFVIMPKKGKIDKNEVFNKAKHFDKTAVSAQKYPSSNKLWIVKFSDNSKITLANTPLLKDIKAEGIPKFVNALIEETKQISTSDELFSNDNELSDSFTKDFQDLFFNDDIEDYYDQLDLLSSLISILELDVKVQYDFSVFYETDYLDAQLAKIFGYQLIHMMGYGNVVYETGSKEEGYIGKYYASNGGNGSGQVVTEYYNKSGTYLYSDTTDDRDIDNDGTDNTSDWDMDGDWLPNFIDPDDDNDGTPDSEDSDPDNPYKSIFPENEAGTIYFFGTGSYVENFYETQIAKQDFDSLEFFMNLSKSFNSNVLQAKKSSTIQLHLKFVKFIYK